MGFLKSGFTFIEIVVAVMLLGIMATFVIPNLQRLRPGYERQEFISKLNALVDLAHQNAMTTNQVHRIWFDLEKKIFEVQVDAQRLDQKGDPVFEPMPATFIKPTYTWPETLKVVNFYIQGTDELHRPGRTATQEVWFFITPEGLAQAVIINMVDTSDTQPGAKGEPLGLVLNPFTVRFTQHDTHQKP